MRVFRETISSRGLPFSSSCWCQVIDSKRSGAERNAALIWKHSTRAQWSDNKTENFGGNQMKASCLPWWIISLGGSCFSYCTGVKTRPDVCECDDWLWSQKKQEKCKGEGHTRELAQKQRHCASMTRFQTVYYSSFKRQFHPPALKHWQCFGAKCSKCFSWFPFLQRKIKLVLLLIISKYSDISTKYPPLADSVQQYSKWSQSICDFLQREADSLLGQRRSDDAKLSENVR